MSDINKFGELVKVVEKIGMTVSEQTRGWVDALGGGVEITSDELLETPEGLITIAPNGDLYRHSIFINQKNCRNHPGSETADDWHKYHLHSCQTIKNYPGQHRYVQTNNAEGLFQYILTYNNTEYKRDARLQGRKLNLCKNCHKQLPVKFRQYAVDNFPLDLFYKTEPDSNFGNTFKYDHDQIPRVYPADWKKIATALKVERSWQCELCHINLSKDRRYLHAHHNDGNIANSVIANLKALCICCHAKQPLHEHMEGLPDYKQFIEHYGQR